MLKREGVNTEPGLTLLQSNIIHQLRDKIYQNSFCNCLLRLIFENVAIPLKSTQENFCECHHCLFYDFDLLTVIRPRPWRLLSSLINFQFGSKSELLQLTSGSQN